jgi:hypothetical protein
MISSCTPTTLEEYNIAKLEENMYSVPISMLLPLQLPKVIIACLFPWHEAWTDPAAVQQCLLPG